MVGSICVDIASPCDCARRRDINGLRTRLHDRKDRSDRDLGASQYGGDHRRRIAYSPQKAPITCTPLQLLPSDNRFELLASLGLHARPTNIFIPGDRWLRKLVRGGCVHRRESRLYVFISIVSHQVRRCTIGLGGGASTWPWKAPWIRTGKHDAFLFVSLFPFCSRVNHAQQLTEHESGRCAGQGSVRRKLAAQAVPKMIKAPPKAPPNQTPTPTSATTIAQSKPTSPKHPPPVRARSTHAPRHFRQHPLSPIARP